MQVFSEAGNERMLKLAEIFHFPHEDAAENLVQLINRVCMCKVESSIHDYAVRERVSLQLVILLGEVTQELLLTIPESHRQAG